MKLETLATKNERSKIKIEHLPELDVVLNLDYSFPEKCHTVVSAIKKGGLEEIEKLKDPNGKPQFFIKNKGIYNQEGVDFMRGRSDIDFINPDYRHDYDTESRYAALGILSELTLSKKIRTLVSTSAFQEVAQEYSFSSLSFAEPIVGVIDKLSNQKYVIFKNIDGIRLEDRAGNDQWMQGKFKEMARKFKKLFLKNGIEAHDLNDLNWAPFMIVKNGNRSELILLDTESYTEARKESLREEAA